MLMRRIAIALATTLCLLLVLFVTTSPETIPSFMLIVPFILIYVALVAVLTLALMYKFSGRHALRRALVIAIMPVFILVLQSIGQLTIRDVLTVTILLAVGYFYVSRSTLKK